MSIPDLFPALPNDILRFIYDIAHLNIEELLKLRLVCKNFKEIIDEYLDGRRGEIRQLIQAHHLNLQDPIYSDFTQKIDALTPLDTPLFKRLQFRHVERHLMLKDLTPEKLDRTFGYMVQHRHFFQRIFPIVTVMDVTPHPTLEYKVLLYRKWFIDYVKENFSTDDKYMQFYDLAFSDQSFENETTPLSLSQYQERYGRVEQYGPLNCLANAYKTARFLAFLTYSGLNIDPDLVDRRTQAFLVLGYSFFLDQHILYTILNYLLDTFAPSLSESPAVHLQISFVAFFIRSIMPLSWPLLRHVDRAIYSCPSAHNFVMDLKCFAHEAVLMMLMFFAQLHIWLFDAIQARLPLGIWVYLSDGFRGVYDRMTEEREELTEQAQRRELRRQSARQNQGNP